MDTYPAVRRPSLEAVIVTFAVTALLTAVSISALWARADGDLDGSVYLLGVAATVALAGGALGAWRLVGDPELRATLMSWPGAAGAVSVGVMVGVAMDDAEGTAYVVGALILGLSVLGHLMVARPAFVTSGLVGLLVLWGQGVSDLFDLSDDPETLGDNAGMILGFALLVITVVVTLLGRRFLPSGDFAGVLMGAVAVIGYLLIVAGVGVIGFFMSLFADFESIDEDGGGAAPDANVYDNDLWVLLVCAVALMLFWLALHWWGGHDGYRVLGLALAPTLVPLIAFVLGAEHPSFWIAVAAVLGVAALAAAFASALGLLRPAASAGQLPPSAPGSGGQGLQG
ncbi:hypothetical protein [Nocardioides daejeonensis]|uniref:hypothetical protein n=1 Tax=Nocardioides daejeonensis TaxID=1046556 RepID=UPI000D750311|nr:hypothetical protein [Nocardioides daejeonensis]